MGSTASVPLPSPIYGRLIVLIERKNGVVDVTGYTVADNRGLPIVIAMQMPNPSPSMPHILGAPTALLKFLTEFLQREGWSGWAVYSVGNANDVGPPPGLATARSGVSEISVILVDMFRYS